MSIDVNTAAVAFHVRFSHRFVETGFPVILVKASASLKFCLASQVFTLSSVLNDCYIIAPQGSPSEVLDITPGINMNCSSRYLVENRGDVT